MARVARHSFFASVRASTRPLASPLPGPSCFIAPSPSPSRTLSDRSPALPAPSPTPPHPLRPFKHPARTRTLPRRTLSALSNPRPPPPHPPRPGSRWWRCPPVTPPHRRWCCPPGRPGLGGGRRGCGESGTTARSQAARGQTYARGDGRKIRVWLGAACAGARRPGLGGAACGDVAAAEGAVQGHGAGAVGRSGADNEHTLAAARLRIPVPRPLQPDTPWGCLAAPLRACPSCRLPWRPVPPLPTRCW
jgi:hypothetical protein